MSRPGRERDRQQLSLSLRGRGQSLRAMGSRAGTSGLKQLLCLGAAVTIGLYDCTMRRISLKGFSRKSVQNRENRYVGAVENSPIFIRVTPRVGLFVFP